MSDSSLVGGKPRFRICKSNSKGGEHLCEYDTVGSSQIHTLAFAYPSLMVMFLTSSFLNRTVVTPDIAFTTVDFP